MTESSIVRFYRQIKPLIDKLAESEKVEAHKYYVQAKQKYKEEICQAVEHGLGLDKAAKYIKEVHNDVY